MKSFSWMMVGVVVLLGSLDGQHARAQAPSDPYPAGYTPYLNLFRPGASLTANYLTLVRPELQATSNVQRLQQQSLDTRKYVQNLNTKVGGSTHKIGFNTHYKYFGGAPTKNFGLQNTINTQKKPANSELTPGFR